MASQAAKMLGGFKEAAWSVGGSEGGSPADDGRPKCSIFHPSAVVLDTCCPGEGLAIRCRRSSGSLAEHGARAGWEESLSRGPLLLNPEKDGAPESATILLAQEAIFLRGRTVVGAGAFCFHQPTER